MDENMHVREVPNWMLYDLIRNMQEQMDIRFSELKQDGIRMEAKLDRNSERIEELYFNRDRVKITFSRAFAVGVTLISAMLSSLMAFIIRD